MSRCLVTGASGFVGSNLAAALCQTGRQVRCLVRASSRIDQLESLDVQLCESALDDVEGLRRAAADVDLVFHVAGCTTALDSQEFKRINVDASRRLAEVCADQPQPPTFVYVSSLAAGGPATTAKPRSEGDRDQPVSDYGRSKLAAERAVSQFADRMPVSIVRPPIIFGPADRASLSLYRTIQLVRIHPLPGLKRFPVSLVHAADLCEALIRVGEHGSRVAPDDPSRGIYYVAGDRAVSYPEFGKLAGRAAGWLALPVPVPRAMFWLVGGIGELVGRVRRRPAVLNFDKIREAMAPGWVCNDAKIRREVGYQPAAPLEQRFAETVKWYREHGWL